MRHTPRPQRVSVRHTPAGHANAALPPYLRGGPVIVHPNKTRITIHIDTDTIDAFRARVQGTSRGYQTAINDALREYLAAETLETTLRRILRDELARTEVSPTAD